MTGAALRLRLAAIAVGILATCPAPAVAQVADTTQTTVDSVVVTPGAQPVVSPAAGDLETGPISPRGAFARSMVIPGWGQAAFDSHFRGGIYFAGWASNWFHTIRTQTRLNDARSRFDRRVGQIEAELIAASPNPDSLRAVLDTVPSILDAAVRADDGPGSGNDLRKLVRAREQQREDWIAWSIFWILASGIDGFVTAHLADFPADIDVRRSPDRTLTLGVRVPLPPSRP